MKTRIFDDPGELRKYLGKKRQNSTKTTAKCKTVGCPGRHWKKQTGLWEKCSVCGRAA